MRNLNYMNSTAPVSATLKAYVEREIMPRYTHFDAAHQPDHIRNVIAQSLFLAGFYDVDINMVYAIAAYHDTGIVAGRENHHIESGKIIRADDHLRRWFTPEQIEIMACAAEDHRASSSRPPRSLYGQIVAEADRDIDPPRILERTVQFGMEHYPQLDKKAHYERFVSHLQEKYADGGYLKLYLPQSPNAAKLEELRAIIRNEPQLKVHFDVLWDRLHQKCPNLDTF